MSESLTGAQFEAPIASSRYKRQLLFLLIVGLFAVFFYNGHRALYDSSEARYALVAREMADSGNWLVPTLFNNPHLTKPPVAYWCIAACIKAFGPAEWAVRLAPGVFFLLTVLITAELARSMWRSEAAGLLAGWAQLTALFPIVSTHVVTTDAFVAAFETLGMFCAWQCLVTTNRTRLWQAALGAAWGAAFMTKGPPALLPCLALIVAAIISRRQLPWRRLIGWPVWLLFIAVALPWYAAVYIKLPGAVATWKKEALTRTLEDPDRQIARWEFLMILSAGALPGFTAVAVGAYRRLRQKRLRELLRSPAAVFLLTWFIVPLIVFMLVKKRLYLYVLPLFPPLAIVAGRVMQQSWGMAGFEYRKAPRWAVAAAAVALLIAVGGRIWYAHKPELYRNFKPLALAIADDAKRQNAEPALLIPAPRDGMGLKYYLGNIQARRQLKKHSSRKGVDAAERKGKHLLLARGLLQPPPAPPKIEYVILKEKKLDSYKQTLDEHKFGKPVTVKHWVALPRMTDDTTFTSVLVQDKQTTAATP